MFLAAQNDRYGQDSDGEVQVYNHYEGVNDQPDYEADVEAEV